MMNDTNKKALLVFGGGILLFMLFRPKSKNWGKIYSGAAVKEESPKDRTPLTEPKADPKDLKGNKKAQDGMVALKAYILAYNAGEPQSELDKLNAELIKTYGLKVYRRGIDNKVVVSDTSGKVIIENNG
jgi:hypothetical protein